MTPIQKILNELSFLLLERDADHKSYFDTYTEEDVMNALTIFNSIASNYGIKNGHIKSPEEAEAMGNAIAQLLLEMTGIDSKTYYK